MSNRDDRLQRRLERVRAAMASPSNRDERLARRSHRGQDLAGSGSTLLALGAAFIATAIATGNKAFFIPGFILLSLGAVRTLRLALKPRADATRAHIGMGADLADGAVVEPGAVVEMGATIGAGAVVRRGAVVRMGSTVQAGAVIEEDAVVGWGSDIKADAVVGAGAVIGAGATVNRGAKVPAGQRLAPGSTFSKAGTPAGASPRAGPTDQRRARIEAACARIEAELSQVPEAFREHLGATGETASSLRETCLELLTRERRLRAEASDESLAFLDQEKAELEQRAAAAADAQVQTSLRSAVQAIEDQKKQRLGLRTQADRLEAELTRLQWTLEGMGTQLVRLRTAGLEAGQAPGAEVLQTVRQLHEEIDAIAEALEDVGRGDSPLEPISEISSESTAPRERDRVR